MNAPHQAQPPLQHVVLLKFCQALTAAEDAEMRAMVASWPTTTDGRS